jgi:hypothetical protein
MIKSFLPVVVLAGLLLNVARADILFDKGNHVETGALDCNFDQVGYQSCDSFVLPTDATLTGLTWKGFWALYQPPTSNDNFEVFLYVDDVTGKPVSSPPFSAFYSASVTLSDEHATGETFSNGEPFYQYTASIPAVSLSGGTKYWLEIFNNNISQNYEWAWAVDENAGGQMFFQLYQSINPNNDWEDNGDATVATFQLTGTPAPEPSTLALLTLGGFGLFMPRRS